jgi:hypothetical protein
VRRAISQKHQAKHSTRSIRTQSNHLFASILAYAKLEKYKFTTSLNHFAMRTKLYISTIKAALKGLDAIKTESGLLALRNISEKFLLARQ